MPGCITLVSRLLETFDLAACWKVMPLGHGCEALSAKVLWKQDRRAWRQICHHSKIQTVKQTMWAQLTAHFTPLRNANEQKWTSMMFQLPVSFPHLFLFPQRPGRVERLFFSSLQGTCRPTPGRGPWSFARCPARPTEDVPLFLFDWDGQTSPQAVNQPAPHQYERQGNDVLPISDNLSKWRCASIGGSLSVFVGVILHCGCNQTGWLTHSSVISTLHVLYYCKHIFNKSV